MRVHGNELARPDHGREHADVVVLEDEAVELRRGDERVELFGPILGCGACHGSQPIEPRRYGSRSPVTRAAPSEPSRSSAATPANHDDTSRVPERCAMLTPSCL